MGFMKFDAIPEAKYLCDTVEDLSTLLPRPGYGDTCWVISEAREYIRNSKGEWLPKDKTSAGVDTKVDLTGYATEDFVQKQIQNIEHPTVEVPSKLSELENDVNHVSQDYVDTKIADLVNSAPETLDTIGEIAQALKEHQDVADAITEAIGKKADKEDLPSIEGLASEAFVTEAIQKIEFPVTDLSNYYTKDEVTQAIIDNAELPVVNNAHMQLVTDAEGNKVWEDKLCYSYVETTEILAEQTLNTTGYLRKPAQHTVQAGQEYIVIYNGTTYNCMGNDLDSTPILGNASLMDENRENTGEPFLLFGLMQNAAGFGVFSQDGPHTFSVVGEQIKYKAIDGNYLAGGIFEGTGEHAHVFNGGDPSRASGTNSASFNNGDAPGYAAFAIGGGTASGMWSLAGGENAQAKGRNSVAFGHFTIATAENSLVIGSRNIEDTEKQYAHIIGNGNYEVLGNIHTVDWKGNAKYAGDIYVNGSKEQDLADAKKVATEEYVENKYLQKSETYTKSLSFNGEIEGKEVFGDCFYKVSNDTPALEDWAGHTLFFESGTEAPIDDMYQGPLNSYPNDGYNINNMIIVFYNDVEGVASKGIYFEWIDYGKVAGANYTAHKTVIPEELLDSDLIRTTTFNELADTVKDLNKYCAFMKQGDQIKLGNIQEYSKMYEMLNGANKFHATLAITFINEEGLLISETCYAKSVMQAIDMSGGGSPYVNFTFETFAGETIRFRWNSDNTISNVSITKNLTEEDINALIEAKIAPAE